LRPASCVDNLIKIVYNILMPEKYLGDNEIQQSNAPLIELRRSLIEAYYYDEEPFLDIGDSDMSDIETNDYCVGEFRLSTEGVDLPFKAGDRALCEVVFGAPGSSDKSVSFVFKPTNILNRSRYMYRVVPANDTGELLVVAGDAVRASTYSYGCAHGWEYTDNLRAVEDSRGFISNMTKAFGKLRP